MYIEMACSNSSVRVTYRGVKSVFNITRTHLHVHDSVISGNHNIICGDFCEVYGNTNNFTGNDSKIHGTNNLVMGERNNVEITSSGGRTINRITQDNGQTSVIQSCNNVILTSGAVGNLFRG